MDCRLLIFAYSIDDAHPIFSHQSSVIRRIADLYSEVLVLVPGGNIEQKKLDIFIDSLPKNVKGYFFSWKGSRVRKAWSLLSCLIHIKQFRPNLVFYFMTDLFAAVFAFLFKIQRVPQMLWYAHASKPLKLQYSYLLVDAVLTSTEDSFPFKGKKVKYLGQMIDPTLFSYSNRNFEHSFNLVHIGRFDKSKRIDEIIQVAHLAYLSGFPFESLEIVGSPSSLESKQYFHDVRARFAKLELTGWLKFRPAVSRVDIPDLLRSKHIFIHNYQGSLDKTLIEATLSGLAVVTTNQSYIREFGSWSDGTSLERELASFVGLEKHLILEQILERHSIALIRHTIDGWIDRFSKLSQELCDAK